jgi:hypothetical protein
MQRRVEPNLAIDFRLLPFSARPTLVHAIASAALRFPTQWPRGCHFSEGLVIVVVQRQGDSQGIWWATEKRGGLALVIVIITCLGSSGPW